MVLPAGAELIEDVKKAPDHILSSREPIMESIQADYTLNMLNINDTYHVDVIRSRLTRNIADTFDQVSDEIAKALADCIPMGSQEWVKISILPTVQQIIGRTSNRIFVGPPLCWNSDYQKLTTNFAANLMKSSLLLAMFPRPLKAIAAKIFCNFPSNVRQTMEFIKPMVNERFAKMEKLGETWDDPPNDMLMWLMREAKGIERSLEGLARRLLLVNFASIHTTSLTFTQVFYRLLANPEYIEPLRHEVEAVVTQEGWTKAGMDKMHKLDSFVRETQRVHGLSSVELTRLALRPFTFSNGTTIPAGTLVALPVGAIHTDGDIYANPEQFDGFRFSKLRDTKGITGHQAVTISSEHLAFGFGRHACPGRFFAVNEVKALLAHIIVTYDVKFEEGKGVPPGLHITNMNIPRNVDLLFRKRQK
ncbi:cytochrome P450 [Russula compacta]|nr:cytochrome P450 [Russula compacta]